MPQLIYKIKVEVGERRKSKRRDRESNVRRGYLTESCSFIIGLGLLYLNVN